MDLIFVQHCYRDVQQFRQWFTLQLLRFELSRSRPYAFRQIYIFVFRVLEGVLEGVLFRGGVLGGAFSFVFFGARFVLSYLGKGLLFFILEIRSQDDWSCVHWFPIFLVP